MFLKPLNLINNNLFILLFKWKISDKLYLTLLKDAKNYPV